VTIARLPTHDTPVRLSAVGGVDPAVESGLLVAVGASTSVAVESEVAGGTSVAVGSVVAGGTSVAVAVSVDRADS
jgi:hypothetical protein